MKVLGKVKAKSRQGQSKVKARSRPGQEKVGASSWQGQGVVKTRVGGKVNNSNSFNKYQINFYRSQLSPYEELQH